MRLDNIINPNEPIRALSWRNPYAEMMLHGKIETRTWNTKYRGWVLICASQKGYLMESVDAISGELHAGRMVMEIGHYWANNLKSHGNAIAIGKLVNTWQMRPQDEDDCYVMHKESLWCHEYVCVTPIEQFGFKGSQGWRILADHIREFIKPN